MESQRIAQKLPLYSKIKAWGFKPAVVDFYLQRVWPTFSLERILAKVRAVRPEARGISTLTLRPNFNFKNFQAGQHVLVTASVNGHRITRTYSPTRVSEKRIEITVKEIADGRVSPTLNRNLKRGDSVEISEPFGEMTWKNFPRGDHFIFCGGGVGITPLRSLIRAWSEDDALSSTTSIDLHYWAKCEDEHCFKKEFNRIATRLPNLRLHLHASNLEKVSLDSAIRSSLSTTSSQSDASATVVACGPQSFVQSAEASALANKLTFFGEHAHVSQVVDEGELTEERFFEINYDGKTLKASSNKTLLESLEAAGLEPVHGCRMGLCKSCTCLKREGTSISMKDQSLSTESNEEIQICVSKPRSPITIERY